MTKAEFCSDEFPIARFMCTLKKKVPVFLLQCFKDHAYPNKATESIMIVAMKFTRKDNILCVHLLSTTQSSVSAVLWTGSTCATTAKFFSLREPGHLPVPKILGKHSNPQLRKLACCQLRAGSKGLWHSCIHVNLLPAIAPVCFILFLVFCFPFLAEPFSV